MNRFSVCALTALIGLAATGGALAADAKIWPFNDKAPRDPALGLVTKIDDLKVDVTDIDPKLVTIEVKATAPRPGYTDLTLVNRPGKLNDRIFAFEVRGRPPQTPEEEETPTPVTAGGTYKEAPVASIDVIEIYAKENCIAYSLADAKQVECTTRVPEDETL